MAGTDGAAPVRRTSKLAILAFVLSLLLCLPLVPLLGAVLGVVALLRIEKHPELGGRGLAIASIPMGVVSLFLAGILAAIAIPSFLRYVALSKQSEAKDMLKELRTAEFEEKERTGQYRPLAELGLPLEEGRRYTLYLGDDVAEATRAPALPLPPDVHTHLGPDGFVACAVGNPDGDDDVDVWCIDETGSLENVRPDVTP